MGNITLSGTWASLNLIARGSTIFIGESILADASCAVGCSKQPSQTI